MADEFQERLASVFRSEAEEEIRSLSSELRALERDPGSARARDRVASMYLQVHSLKGAARSVNRSDMHVLSQALERLLLSWKQGPALPAVSAFSALHEAVALLAQLLANPTPEARRRVAELAEGLGRS